MTQRFAYSALVVASLAIIIIGKADVSFVERLRIATGDLMAPVMSRLAQPAAAATNALTRVHDLFVLYQENQRLKDENATLLQWQQVARRLETENRDLRQLTNYAPGGATWFITGRVIGAAGGAYSRSVMIDRGSADGIAKGQAATSGTGLVGRVEEVGGRAARILLVTDINSRIPVVLQSTGWHRRLDRRLCSGLALDRAVDTRVFTDRGFRPLRLAAAKRGAGAEADQTRQSRYRDGQWQTRHSVRFSGPVRVYGILPKVAPVTVTASLAVLAAVPIAIPEYAAVTPNFVLMSLFHWTLYRPEYLGYLAVFLIGLFFDLLTTAPGTTLGLTSLVLLAGRWAVFSNRKFFIARHFPFVWLWFAALTVGTDMVVWLMVSVLNGFLLNPRSLAFQAVLTIALFPPAAWVFARLQRWSEEITWPL